MRRAGALLLICGCNQVFGLDPTHAVPAADAQYFDAPADAPFACPAVGGTPVFSNLLHQIPVHCSGYEAAPGAGIATATCSFDNGQQIAIGSLDGPFTPVDALAQVGNDRLDVPQLTPEGDELFVRHWNLNTTTSKIAVYRRDGGTFTFAHELPPTFDSFVKVSRPSSGPVRRLLIQNPPNAAVVEYAVDATGGLTQIHAYTSAELGVNYVFSLPSLSPDGLRAVFSGGTETGNATFYTDRPSLDALFRPATALTDVVINFDPYTTPDCSRLYFSAIGYVFWVQRL